MKYLDTNNRGKFIVIYGANNIGKSTQVSLLASKLIIEYHEQVLIVKYPVYGLDPTGEELRKIIKTPSKNRGLIVDNLQLQKIYAQNRKDFQNVIEMCLRSSINIIAEDYIGTGLAWGMTKGVPLADLLRINDHLLIPDLSILMDGKRFENAIEKGHIFESAGDEIWQRNKEIHLVLAKKYHWKVVNADNPIEQVREDIWNIVSKELRLTDKNQLARGQRHASPI